MRHCDVMGAMLASTLLLGGCGQQPVEPEPRVNRVITYTIPDSSEGALRNYPAASKASELSTLSFRVGGEVVELFVIEGQRVAQGDLLARLDPADFQRFLDKRNAEYNLARRNFERAQQLIESGAVSQSEYDVFRAKFQVASAKRNLARQSLHYTELRAPRAGVIGQVNVKQRETVQPGQGIVTLHDADRLEIELQVSESLISQIRSDLDDSDSFGVRFDSLPGQRFEASYKEHETEQDPASGAFLIRLQMPQPEQQVILPGMSGEVSLDLAKLSQRPSVGTVVPSRTVLYEPTASPGHVATYVWVVDAQSNQASKRPVQTGQLTPRGIEVLSGLRPGDRAVTDGQHNLYPNAPVIFETAGAVKR